MKIILVLLLSACVLAKVSHHDKALQKTFLNWMTEHGKTYSNAEEFAHRMEVFATNLEYIENWNNNPSSTFTLAMNQFGDLTHQEFKDRYLNLRFAQRPKNTDPALLNVKDLPDTWDWRKLGAVTAVGNQEQCGSCWAFSVTGTVEGCHKITTGKLVALSQQQIVDCDTTDDGCDGGLMDNAFQYVMKNGGLDSLACYPYQGQEGNTCGYNKSCCVSTLTSFKDVTTGSESALQAATYLVPVAIGLDASPFSFQYYSSGVYYDPTCSSTELDHSALTVGWGVTSNGTDYWIVKNTWGTSWGMQGYILMARNKGNSCGVATMASYALGCNDC